MNEPKPLPANYRERIKLKPKTGHKERELDIAGGNGGEFRIILRQSDFNKLDFSVILAYIIPRTNHVFRLRRYNGKSHEHTNDIEKETFEDFHIHKATERYQDLGSDEETYAVRTDRYVDLASAVECMLQDCRFQPPNEEQLDLLGGI